MELKEYRERKGMTQEEVGEAICVSAVSVWRYESGKGDPSIDTIRRIEAWSGGLVRPNDMIKPKAGA